jgi:diguanylate cyclase (GGDEF)-like protein
MTTVDAPASDAPASRDAGAQRVMALAGAMSICAGIVWWFAIRPHTVSPLVGGVNPFIVGALVAIGELCTVDVYLRRETHTVSLRSIALVFGLFVLSPPVLLAAYVVGAAAVIVVRDRLSGVKLVFNVALFLVEGAVAIAVFLALAGSGTAHDPTTWVAAIAAAVAIDVLGGLLVTAAISLRLGHLDAEGTGWLVVFGAVTAAANACFALVAVILYSVAPASVMLLGAIGVAMFGAYRAFVSLRQRHSELEVLREYTTALGRTAAFEDVALAALREARERLQAERAEIWFLSAEADRDGVRIALDGDDAHHLDTNFRIPITDTLWGRLVSSPAAVVIPHNSRDAADRELLEQYRCDDLVAAQLLAEHGMAGVVLLRDRLGDVGTFDAADGRLLSALGRYTSIALENGRLVDALQAEAARREHQALHDQLTDLPNRRYLIERESELLPPTETTSIAAMLLVDLDGLKEINDTFGHASGDAVLVEVAARLREVVDNEVTLVRLGGDEFALLLPGVATGDAVDYASRIRAAVIRPHVVNRVTVQLDTNAGIAMYPEHGTDVSTLLRCADVAMWQARDQRAASCVYRAEQDSHTPERLALAADLRAALAEGSLALGYQPIKALGLNRIVNVEVLSRWEHPTRGLLPPPVYIEVAEQSDLIRELTSYVLQHALEQRRDWVTRGLDLTVSVNVSVHDLNREGFAAEVAHLLAETATPRGRLVLELTETQALHHPERIAPVLAELRTHGVVVAIDDFGTGYSSLTSLRSLPVDEIKIDKSFVSTMTSNEHDNAIVRSIIELARRLNLDIVAEGVEDQETERQLHDLGCHHVQGYVLTKALAAPELEAWINSHFKQISGANIVPLRRSG